MCCELGGQMVNGKAKVLGGFREGASCQLTNRNTASKETAALRILMVFKVNNF